MSDAGDDRLIQEYRQGDVLAFEQLYRRHARAVYSYLRVEVGAAAEDLLQETFSRLLAGLGGYRCEGKFRAYLFRIARNLARDHQRRREPSELVEEVRAEAPDLAGRLDVRRALLALSPEQREVVLLREYAGLPFEEVARLTGSPLGTVLARMHRALKRLRQELTREVKVG